MKTKFLVLAIIVHIGLLPGFCFSQLQIRADQFPTALGDSFTYFDTDTTIRVSFDPNANSWDFSSGPTEDTVVNVFIRKQDAVWGDSFPLSQFCIKTYTYKRNRANPNFQFGTKFTDSLITHGYVVWDSLTSSYIIERWFPHNLSYLFPLRAGLSWTSIDSLVLIYMGYRVTVHDTMRNVVLKEGTVIVPWGSSQCLLKRMSMRASIFVDPIGLYDTIRVEYAEWIAPNAGTVAQISSVNYDTTWPITQAVSFSRLWRFMTGIEEKQLESEKVESEKLNLEVFPNPATSVANFRFQISDSRLKIPDYKSSNLSIFQSSISIKIYDVQGRLVRQIPLTLKTDTEVAWDLRDNLEKKVSAGVYFVRLNFNNVSETRKILVLR